MGGNKLEVSYAEARAEPFFLKSDDGRPIPPEDRARAVQASRRLFWSLSHADTPERLDAVLAGVLGMECPIDRSLALASMSARDFAKWTGAISPIGDSLSGTIMHWAVRAGMDAVWAIPAVVACGGDPDLADEHGRTPLMEAARVGSSSAIRALLEAGADPMICCPVVGSTLHVAADRGEAEHGEPGFLRVIAVALGDKAMAALLSVRDSSGLLPEDVARFPDTAAFLSNLRKECGMRAEVAERAEANRGDF
jgi:hypothetical protein